MTTLLTGREIHCTIMTKKTGRNLRRAVLLRSLHVQRTEEFSFSKDTVVMPKLLVKAQAHALYHHFGKIRLQLPSDTTDTEHTSLQLPRD